nr:MAG TPA: hypothetical protein [Caudoviricetes sp.]
MCRSRRSPYKSPYREESSIHRGVLGKDHRDLHTSGSSRRNA